MIVSIVVAASENNAIGKDNQLLWRLPNDSRFFKNTTWGMPVIMGRKTFDSLGKALPGRLNIVITRNTLWQAPETIVTGSLEQAIAAARASDAKEAFVIGGAEIYKEALPLVNRIYLTRVHASLEGDAWFPELDETAWTKLSQLDFMPDARHAYAYSFQVWERKQESHGI
jgi:dihydrofolate reductase